MELMTKLIVSELNKLQIGSILKFVSGKEIYIEDGKITGFILENGNSYKIKIPTQTANPSGDK